MKEKLLPLLCCPDCAGELRLENPARGGDGIESGLLRCQNCAKIFPIERCVPRFVESDRYVSNFSYEWTRCARTQLDSASGLRESADTFSERTGFSPQDLAGKTVLDAGCGMGRYLEIAAKSGAEAVGADLSLAVDSAQANLGALPNVHVVQADIMRLPFKHGTFDAFYSLGVLHHTPDTRKAFMALEPLLKKGGRASIWVYSKESAYLRLSHRFSDFYRIFTSRLPKRLLWNLCKLAAPLYALKRFKKLHTLLDIVLPLSNHPDPDWRVLDTFDWYSPRYQFKHTYAEVKCWFIEAGFEKLKELPFPVSVTGIKN